MHRQCSAIKPFNISQNVIPIQFVVQFQAESTVEAPRTEIRLIVKTEKLKNRFNFFPENLN